MLGGEKDAHHVVAHAVRVASVHEQIDSVVKKMTKKGCRFVHVVALEEEGLIDLHITVLAFKVSDIHQCEENHSATHFQSCVRRERSKRSSLLLCSTIRQSMPVSTDSVLLTVTLDEQ
jgi:hypothetical protein